MCPNYGCRLGKNATYNRKPRTVTLWLLNGRTTKEQAVLTLSYFTSSMNTPDKPTCLVYKLAPLQIYKLFVRSSLDGINRQFPNNHGHLEQLTVNCNPMDNSNDCQVTIWSINLHKKSYFLFVCVPLRINYNSFKVSKFICTKSRRS